MQHLGSWITKRLTTMAVAAAVVASVAGVGQARAGSVELPASPLIDRIKEAGVMRAGVAIFLPVIGQKPDTGEYIGTGVDIANWMAEEMGVKVEFIPQAWDAIIAAIQANQIDIAVAGLYATEARLKVVNMTNYVEYGFCYAALKDNNKVNTLADLNKPDIVFAQMEGGGTYQITSKAYPNAQHKARLGLPGEQVTWAEVLSGEADVVPFDPPLVQIVNKELPQLKIIPSDCGLEKSDMPSPIAFAYPKDDPGFQQYAEDFVKRHHDDILKSLETYSSSEYLDLGLVQ
jgi:polar amino acid transport system substrate-binding protein